MTVAKDRAARATQAATKGKLLGQHGVRTVALVAVVTGLAASGAATAFGSHLGSSN